MSGLKTFLTEVPSSKVEAFIDKYVNPSDGSARSTAYDSYVVFLEGTGQIFTQGTLYGANDSSVQELFKRLEGFDSTSTDGSTATVLEAIQYAKEELLGTPVTSADKEQTIGAVSDRIQTLEDLISRDDDGKIDKLQEVLDWFADTSDNSTNNYIIHIENADGTDSSDVNIGTAEAGLLTTVAENKYAIGHKNTAPENASSNATGLYKEIEDAIKKAERVIEVAADSSAYLSVSGDPEQHTLTVHTTTLNDAVGMTLQYVKYDEDGAKTTKSIDEYAALTDEEKADYSPEYVAGDGDGVVAGLATAGDVAAEMVADEEVIAAALNDHEERISALENGELNIADSSKSDEDGDVYVRVDSSKGLISAVDVVVNTAEFDKDTSAWTASGIVNSSTLEDWADTQSPWLVWPE